MVLLLKNVFELVFEKAAGMFGEDDIFEDSPKPL